MARTRSTRESPKDLTKQARIDATVRDTLPGVFQSFRSAAIAHKVRTCTILTSLQINFFQVPPQTVRDRAAGKATQHSLINEAQEKVLVDWCYHNPDSATPLHPRILRGRVLEMVGTYPGKNWVRRFVSRHPDILVTKPRGLDPKRAQNFNKATIMEYFDMRSALKKLPIFLCESKLTWKILKLAAPLEIILDFQRFMAQNVALHAFKLATHWQL